MRNPFKSSPTPRHARRPAAAAAEVPVLVDEPEPFADRVALLRAALRTGEVVEASRAAARRAALRPSLEDVFADGAAWRSGHECDTDAQALGVATRALADREHGARRAMLVLAGHVGLDAPDLLPGR